VNGDPEIDCPCGYSGKMDFVERVNNNNSWLEYLIYQCPKCGKRHKH